VISDLKEYVHLAPFKRVFDQLECTQTQNRARHVSIVSQRPREGRTFVTAALALAHAELLRRRVLIIDAGGGAHERGGLELKAAFGPPCDGPLLPLPSPGVQWIDLSAWGGGGASEYAIGNILADGGQAFDVVLVDTCALAAVGSIRFDPVVAARQTGAALFVVSAKSSLSAFDIAGSKIKVVGVVTNEVAVGS
jgi:Mrp family chromosome partitioning ATPase